MEQMNSHNPDAVFVDGTGIGWGVHDRLNQLGCPNLVGVDFGAKADRTDASDAAARYANKRAEMWGFMKEWLKVGSLPDDNELLADLKAVDYGYDASDAILLERKDDMRRRGLASPDDGDALALTFAYPEGAGLSVVEGPAGDGVGPRQPSSSRQPRSSTASMMRSRWPHQMSGGMSKAVCHTGTMICNSTAKR
jgi:hypothetical protein